MTTIHIHAPQPDAFGLLRNDCPTCGKRTWKFWMHTPWYGEDHTCLRCGEEWQDGYRSERPFAPGWRKKQIAAARARWRKLKAAQLTPLKSSKPAER